MTSSQRRPHALKQCMRQCLALMVCLQFLFQGYNGDWSHWMNTNDFGCVLSVIERRRVDIFISIKVCHMFSAQSLRIERKAVCVVDCVFHTHSSEDRVTDNATLHEVSMVRLRNLWRGLYTHSLDTTQACKLIPCPHYPTIYILTYTAVQKYGIFSHGSPM